ncbi:SH3 domain-containing protein [Streptomyces sp. CLV115]|uniref:SH3 domain-containing protein n=1 Tax=Streptomyces sp. CLV115 TaxID=3138502 RepID=UPI00313ADAB4
MDEHTDTASDAATDTATDVSENVVAAGSDDVTRYPIAPGYRVNVRTGPGTKYGIVRTLPYGMKIPVYCQKPGERVTGPYGTSNIWDNIANGQFVADAYVHTGSDGYIAPRCD